MTWNVRIVSALTLLLTVALLSSHAGGKIDKEAVANAEEKAKQIQLITEAHKLAEFGEKHKSPLALVTAGGLLWHLKGLDSKIEALNQAVEVEYEKDATRGDPAPDGAPKLVSLEKQAKALFDTALIYADKDVKPAITKLIKEVKEDKRYVGEKDRGSTDGPRRINRYIAGGATHVFKIHFVSGLPAQVGFQSTGPCMVTIVRSDNDHVMAAGAATRGGHTWVPGGPPGRNILTTIRIRNMTPQAVSYVFLTN